MQKEKDSIQYAAHSYCHSCFSFVIPAKAGIQSFFSRQALSVNIRMFDFRR